MFWVSELVQPTRRLEEDSKEKSNCEILRVWNLLQGRVRDVRLHHPLSWTDVVEFINVFGLEMTVVGRHSHWWVPAFPTALGKRHPTRINMGPFPIE